MFYIAEEERQNGTTKLMDIYVLCTYRKYAVRLNTQPKALKVKYDIGANPCQWTI